MIQIEFKHALILWSMTSLMLAGLQILFEGRDTLIIDLITPAYWMFVMLLVMKDFHNIHNR